MSIQSTPKRRGRPPGSKNKEKPASQLDVDALRDHLRIAYAKQLEVDDILEAIPTDTPLDYMLRVMNDPTSESGRRDKMAIAAAPYMHFRKADDKSSLNKKVQQAATAQTLSTSGKYASPPPPLRAVKS